MNKFLHRERKIILKCYFPAKLGLLAVGLVISTGIMVIATIIIEANRNDWKYAATGVICLVFGVQIL